MNTISEAEGTRPIPQVREWPLLGSIPGMASDPLRYLLKCHRQYGSVFKIHVLGNEYTVLAGADAANFMNSREGKECLRSREFWEGLVKEYDAKSALPGVDGEEHAELRKVLRRGYSKESIKGRYNELVEITDRAIARDWQPDSTVPVLESFQFMVTDQLGIMITGDAPLEYVADIRIMILYILNCLVTRQRPEFLMRLNPRYRKAKQRVFELGDQMKADYLSGDRHTEHRTLVDDIMETHRDNPALMPAKNLRLHLTAPYVAGLDTVANTTAACVYTILKHPEVHARVQREIDDFFADGGPIEEARLMQRLPALNGAIMETMRLYPIAPAQMRTAHKDFVFDGHQIREGDTLYLACTITHLMEEYFPHPERFDIDRYAPPREEHKQSGVYSPYGRGPHTCLGKSLAEIQLLLTMARIFYKLDLALPAPDYELKTKTAPTPGPARSFSVRVKGYRN
ncbi:cytochrome P450 [Algiphilus sp.]|uniref:cytochrome P450 n=1 Tax=Algiphilus sp. TaxID=1872431 RepID=UPI0032EF413F